MVKTFLKRFLESFSIFTISALIYLIGYFILLLNNCFDKEFNQEECFMMFFLSGIISILIYKSIQKIIV